MKKGIFMLPLAIGMAAMIALLGCAGDGERNEAPLGQDIPAEVTYHNHTL